MRVLVPGAAGYIGSTLCPALLGAGHSVTALDSFRYGPQQATALAACCADPRFDLVRGDVRDQALFRDLVPKHDAIVWLAALVGAPLCERYPEEALSVNQTAVERFVRSNYLSQDQLVAFPNTNSGYGVGGSAECDETSPLTPISTYGRTKVAAESAILENHAASVVFRLATVFGPSPRMRVDLLVNDFVLRALRDRALTIFEPHARRNFVHVRDVAAAFLYALSHPDRMLTEGRVFNAGNDDANVTKLELAEEIRKQVPDLDVFECSGADPDARDYLVSNARLRAAGFAARRSLASGVEELLKLYRGFPTFSWGNV